MNPDRDSPNTGESQYPPCGTQYPSGGWSGGTSGGGWGNAGPGFGAFACGNQFPASFISVPWGFRTATSGAMLVAIPPCRPVTPQSPVYLEELGISTYRDTKPQRAERS